VGYLSSIFHLVDISLVYKRLFSLGYGYFIALNFIVAQIGIGSLFLRLPFLRNLNLKGLTYLLFSLCGGFYFSYFLLMILALLNWLNGPGILIYLLPAVLSIYLGYKSLKEVLFSNIKKINLSPDKKKIIKQTIIISLLIIIWILPYFIQTLLPNTDWDGASFHLPQAKRFLNGKISSLDAYYTPYNYPGAIHLFYAFLLFLEAEAAVIPLNFIFAIFIIIAVYCISTHFWTKKVGFLAACICIAVNLLWEVALTPRIDVFLTFFFVLSFFSFFLWIKTKEKTGFLIFFGMFLGITMGIKFTAATFVLVLFPATFYLFFFNKKKLNLSIIPFLFLILTLAMPSLYWYGRNYLNLGDPIYPFISGFAIVSYEGHIFNFELPQKKIESISNQNSVKKLNLNNHKLDFLYHEQIYPKYSGTLFNLYDVLVHPEKHQRKPLHEINIFLFLMIFIPFFSRKKIELYLFGITLITYIIIASQTFLLRYALPLFPLFSIGSAVFISHIKSKKIVNIIFVLICLNFFSFSMLEWQKLSKMKPINYIFGNSSRIDWLLEVGYNNKLLDTPLLIKYINTNLIEGHLNGTNKLFMIGECKGYLMGCDYLPDNPSNPSNRWLAELILSNFDHNTLKKNLTKQSVTHLIYNESFFQKISFESPPYKKEIMKFCLYNLYKFINDHSDIIYDKSGIIVAKIIFNNKEI
jgi:4-amino-4-deoxy-L-arabinose transferase-like glycosyltransferase